MSLICFKKLFVSVLNIWSSLTSPFFAFHPLTRENCSVFLVWYLKVSLCSWDDLKMAVVQRNEYDTSQPWTYSRKGKSRVVVIILTSHHSDKTTPATDVSSILLWFFFTYWWEFPLWDLTLVKSSVLSQAAMIFQWIKPGDPPGLKYLGRTLALH